MTLGSAILDERANAVSTIRPLPFRIAAGLLFALALLSVGSRIYLKIRHARTFHLDDYILFFGTACLVASTGMLFNGLDSFYLGPVIQSEPQLVALVPMRLLMELKRQLGFIYAMLALIWTATFSVKLSFLAFFRDIVRAVRGIRWFYRITIGMTILSYIYVIINPFIVCSQFGAKTVTCYQKPDMGKYAALTYLGTSLDISTDLMIVMIPIFILHRTRIQLRQKVAVGTLLCLSIVMAVISLVRSAKIHGPANVPEDTTWMLFWVYAESAVAILMVSLTAFRTVFNQRKEEESRRERLKKPPTYRRYLPSTVSKADEDMGEAGLPQIPGPTFQGLKTRIGRTGCGCTFTVCQDAQDKPSPASSISEDRKKSVESFV